MDCDDGGQRLRVRLRCRGRYTASRPSLEPVRNLLAALGLGCLPGGRRLSRRPAEGEGRHLGQVNHDRRRRVVGAGIHHRGSQQQLGGGLPGVRPVWRLRSRIGVFDRYHHRRQVVSGEARCEDRIRMRWIRLRCGAFHLHLQLRAAPQHLRMGARSGWGLHAGGCGDMRLLLPGPPRRTGGPQMSTRCSTPPPPLRPVSRACRRTRLPSGNTVQWRRSRPACCR